MHRQLPSRARLRAQTLAALGALLALVPPVALLFVSIAAADARPLAFAEAQRSLLDASDKLKAADANVDRRQHEARAIENLGALPDITLNATQVYGRKDFEFGPFPIVGKLTYNYNFDGPRSSLLANWPIYTGGRITAAQKALAAEVDVSRAERRDSGEKLELELIQRYFGLRLATTVERLRTAQLELADRQLNRAQRFESEGQLAKVERLSAQVARDEAARDQVKAQRDREIAEAALSRMLREGGPIQPTTPLFVLTTALAPLAQWVDEADAASPALAGLHAKAVAVDQGIDAAQSSFLPDVFAFGQYNMITSHLTPIEPNWVFGIGVNFKLYSSEDRSSKVSAARSLKQEIDAVEAEARNQVRTGVEAAWLRVAQTREQFKLYDSSLDLARENLRLRERGFEAGQATTLDINDARNSLLRVETGRAQAAYEFVLALATLLEVSGQMGRFGEFVQRADVTL
mgnify:CR=1 FL=1